MNSEADLTDGFAGPETQRIPITYGDFHDIPRMICFEFAGKQYFLWSYFDSELDEYIDRYEVYELPYKTVAEREAHPRFWELPEFPESLGHMPLKAVGLDATLRKTIDSDAFAKWLDSHTSSKGIPQPS
jgi:hypothetical protein